jgi:hypothetical protein
MNIGGEIRTVSYVGDKDDLVRLTVEISDQSSKLFPYIKWRKRPKSPTHAILYKMQHVRQWYVYLDRIAPNMITEVRPLSGQF